MPGNRVRRAFSAGGVIFRVGSTVPAGSDAQPSGSAEGSSSEIEVVLVGRSHSGIWALPKGTPQKGESARQAALREVREETGLQIRIVASLGSAHYSFIRSTIRYDKEVRYFFMEPIGGDLSLHDAEYDEVRWFPLSEAYQRLTYETDSQIVQRAEDLIQRRRSNRPRRARRPGHP
jgi:8-oxo-dGTP pyrophosphatase MutT (NUDIX family)